MNLPYNASLYNSLFDQKMKEYSILFWFLLCQGFKPLLTVQAEDVHTVRVFAKATFDNDILC